MYQVILYYNFTPIQDPEQFCKQHKQLCAQLNLKGRIYISQEGINGTLAGSFENIDQYKNQLQLISGFESTEFKTEECEYIPFERLTVKTRDEIVVLKGGVVNPNDGTAQYLEPDEWKKVLDSNEDYVLIDVRNNYESEIGHFEGALKPDVENFYDFPQWLEQAKIDKDKKVLMYCTGGIRCEKFSPYMKAKGYKDVNQLHGGIIRYAQEQGGKHFKGKCFVFDDRMVVPVDEEEKEPISKCAITGVPCDQYINCANMTCNKLFICSREGAIQMEGCCSEECKNSEHRRPFDVDSLYKPFRRWYKYFEEKPV